MSGFAVVAVLSAMCVGQYDPPDRSDPEFRDHYSRYDSWDLRPNYRALATSVAPMTGVPTPPVVSAPRVQAARRPIATHYASSKVRRDLSTLAPDSPTLQSLRKGIEAMKKLPADDPHNWNNWANMHGYPADTPKPNPLWGQCQHGNWWFFPWHRAYLIYTERIIRRYSKDPSFALPYWDYANNRTLPAPYRDPKSTLYDSTRISTVNNGRDSLNPLVVVVGTDLSMANRVFADFGPVMSFGGRALNAPEHMGRPHGALEAVPHDLVHGFVGGNMSLVDRAARDPVFFAHHANVDRLWVAWLQLGQGRANPSDDVWLNQKFTFYDENKKQVSVAVRDLLDTAALGYVYDKPTGPADNPGQPAPQTDAETVATLQAPNTSLQNQPVTLTLKMSDEMRGKLQDTVPPRIYLQMDEVTFPACDSAIAVYVNLPANSAIPGPLSAFYAGCFTFFGEPGHAGFMASQVDVTSNLEWMWTTQWQQRKDITVTLVRTSCGQAARDFKTPCTFNQLSLSVTK